MTPPDKQENEHTPAPWVVLNGDNFIYGIYRKGTVVEKTVFFIDKRECSNAKQDMNFILRAVNSHEALLEALKKVEKYAFKASGDEFLMWAQEAIAQAEGKNP